MSTQPNLFPPPYDEDAERAVPGWRLECERPLSLRQEVIYLIQERTPPITFALCFWKAIQRRLGR